jgi:hypothetical protein
MIYSAASRSLARNGGAGGAGRLAGDELDKPVPGNCRADGSASHEFRLSNDSANLARVFYLAGSPSPQELQKVFEQVRANTGIRRLFVYNALGALAVRGTVGQVATAEKALEEMKAQ